jgi:hypothetical protein
MSNRTLDSSSLQPALLGKTYTDFSSEVDLLADCYALTGNKTKEPTRRIRVTSGDVVACYFALAPTTKVLVEYAENDVDDVQLVKIGSAADGTTATKITVYW